MAVHRFAVDGSTGVHNVIGSGNDAHATTTGAVIRVSASYV